MNERLIAMPLQWGAADGTLTGNVSAVIELPYPWVFKCIKACASNDSSATLAVTGGATVTAAAIGDSGDPSELAPASDTYVAADTAVTFSLDFDGASGTAAANVSAIVIGWVGDGA